METFVYEVTLKINVEAFDESDAEDAVRDALGEGELSPGVTITETKIQ